MSDADDDELIAAVLAKSDEPYEQATEGLLDAVEDKLDVVLPRLLRRLYLEVGDGGFGPGVGGMMQCSKLIQDPPGLVWICDWGCAQWSCLDCRTADGPIVTVAGDYPPTETEHTLRTWLRAWLDGVDLEREMFHPGPKRTVTNPFTKKPIETEGQGKPRGRPWK